MKQILILIVLLSFLSNSTQARSLEIKEFAFGGIGFGGATSNGELIFRKLYSSSEPFKAFKKFYREQEGNNEAQMYAMVAFYYLDKSEYERIKVKFKDKIVKVRCMSGCIGFETNLDALLKKIETGKYDDYVPKKKQAEQDDGARSDK